MVVTIQAESCFAIEVTQEVCGEFAVRQASKPKPAWRLNHYVDPQEAISLLHAERKLLAADRRLFEGLPRKAVEQDGFRVWLEDYRVRVAQSEAVISMVESQFMRDNLVLLVVDPSGRQAFKLAYDEAAADLKSAKNFLRELLTS